MLDSNRNYFLLMAQVGVTAFTLMFAAVQFRWDQLSKTKHGKIAAATALFELLTACLVSVAVSSKIDWFWISASFGLATAGLLLIRQHLRTYREDRARGWFPNPSDDLQRKIIWLPHISYFVLGMSSLLWLIGSQTGYSILQEVAEPTLAIVLAWFIFSGLGEVLVVLNPQLLEAEDVYHIESILIPCHETYAAVVQRKASISNDGGITDPEKTIVLLPDIWGLTPQVFRIAKRFADEGYRVVVPDYHGDVVGLRKIYEKLQNPESTHQKVADLADFLSGKFRTKKEMANVFGMSVGATAALTNPSLWRRVVALYPTSFCTDREPVSASNSFIIPVSLETSSPEPRDKWGGEWVTALKEVYRKAKLEQLSGQHGFFTSRSVPWIYRPFLNIALLQGASNRKASNAVWRGTIEFIALESILMPINSPCLAHRYSRGSQHLQRRSMGWKRLDPAAFLAWMRRTIKGDRKSIQVHPRRCGR